MGGWLSRPNNRKPKVMILTGLTGVGKTSLSIKLAKELKGEIISADSVQIYKNLNIGTNKIKKEEMEGIPHYLINILDPSEDFSVNHFFSLARRATEDIIKRGKIPIIVGGTGFYLKWYIYGQARTIASTKEIRLNIETKLNQVWAEVAREKGRELKEEEKWEVGINMLKEAGDPGAAERIKLEKNNYYRLKRALEIKMNSEGIMSEMAINDKLRDLEYDYRCFFLHKPRMQLYKVLGIRCEQMILDGILDECKTLMDLGLKSNQNSVTRSIGYRQTLEYLEKIKNDEIELNDASFVEYIKSFMSATRGLVKQQMTWFRKDKIYKWIDMNQCNHLNVILNEWKKCRHEGGASEIGLLTKSEAKDLRKFNDDLILLDSKEKRELVIDWIKQNII